MQGIYSIKNKTNGKEYIGQSVHVEIRWQEHTRAVNYPDRIEYNYPLYKAFRKYGVSNFNFSILELVDKGEELLEREQFYYDTLKPAYNQNRPETAVVTTTRQPVYQIDMDTLDVIKEFESIAEAVRSYPSIGSTIYHVCNRTRNSAGGFYWCKVDDFEDWTPRRERKNRKAVYQIDIETNKIIDEFESMAEASRKTKTSQGSISNVITGRGKTAGGYKWRLV